MEKRQKKPSDIVEADFTNDAEELFKNSELIYVNDGSSGIKRETFRGKFRYKNPAGIVIKDVATLKRINSLAIPPGYSDVWICMDPRGHIQATGRDAKGRKQYRYHSRFREARDDTKFAHMLEFANALPTIREHVSEDMKRRGLPREKVLAAVVHLLESTMIRIGNASYAKQNKSYGLTTLKNRHVEVDNAELRFKFKGKSGRLWKLRLKDRRIAKVVKLIQDIPGQNLFQYIGDDGNQYEINSYDINSYLKEISGRNITAKDFRTWNGTVLAALALSECTEFDTVAAAKRNIRAAVEAVAARLGNTPAVCRKSYIHPIILESYLNHELVLEEPMATAEQQSYTIHKLRADEAIILAFLERRLADKSGSLNT